MSKIVTTPVGRFRRVSISNPEDVEHPNDAWLWECPCGQWAYLDEDQWAGRVSVDHASEGCPKGYHETHPFGAELIATMHARILAGGSPFDSEESVSSQEKELEVEGQVSLEDRLPYIPGAGERDER